MIKLDLPISEKTIRSLKVGDEVSLYGTMVTGRDTAHSWMIKERPDVIRDLLKESVIYHCGPVVAREDNHWRFVAAGPTTSIREEPYQADIIKEYELRGVMGKGGMGPKTLQGLQDSGAVYLHAVGGAATILAQAVKRVKDVIKLEEFGVPEAMWVIEVEDFRAVVSMDAHGNSLHKIVREASTLVARKLLNLE
ncbi:MAG: fumarate hydrolyase [FCB group bacterium]|nr:fumarate hydrolyase [FCB group bacterium]